MGSRLIREDGATRGPDAEHRAAAGRIDTSLNAVSSLTYRARAIAYQWRREPMTPPAVVRWQPSAMLHTPRRRSRARALRSNCASFSLMCFGAVPDRDV